MTTISTKRTGSQNLIEGSHTISRPGAVIVVTELLLTPEGRKALTSGSRGINEGVRRHAGPPKPNPKDLMPA